MIWRRLLRRGWKCEACGWLNHPENRACFGCGQYRWVRV